MGRVQRHHLLPSRRSIEINFLSWVYPIKTTVWKQLKQTTQAIFERLLDYPCSPKPFSAITVRGCLVSFPIQLDSASLSTDFSCHVAPALTTASQLAQLSSHLCLAVYPGHQQASLISENTEGFRCLVFLQLDMCVYMCMCVVGDVSVTFRFYTLMSIFQDCYSQKDEYEMVKMPE